MFQQGGEAGYIIAADPASEMPRVAADRQRVTQALLILFTYIARHATDGSSMRVGARRDGFHVAVSVTGKGLGVAAERLSRLLDQPSRLVGGDGEHAPTGEALGLAVCSGIVEAHGGRIWTEVSEAGICTGFTFTLPAADEAAYPAVGGDVDRTSAGTERRVGLRARILVVDNDPQMLWYTRNTLQEAGYVPVTSGDIGEVFRLIRAERPHLVLLALDLRGEEELDLMRRIVATADAPVVFLCGAGREQDVDLALETGAADYIVKPFSPTELAARTKASLLRRVAENRAQEPYRLGDLVIDYGERRVTLADQSVSLTETEYRLLAELSVHAGRVVTRNQLLQRVWPNRTSPDPRVVRAYVMRLREKLGDDANDPRYIVSEPRVGYRMGAG